MKISNEVYLIICLFLVVGFITGYYFWCEYTEPDNICGRACSATCIDCDLPGHAIGYSGSRSVECECQGGYRINTTKIKIL